MNYDNIYNKSDFNLNCFIVFSSQKKQTKSSKVKVISAGREFNAPLNRRFGILPQLLRAQMKPY